MQFRNWGFLAAAVMVAASPLEKPITIDHFPICEVGELVMASRMMKYLTEITQQECMRQENWQLNIDKVTFTTFCVGEHRKMAFLVWVREQLEPCFYYRCGLERDSQEIIGEINPSFIV